MRKAAHVRAPPQWYTPPRHRHERTHTSRVIEKKRQKGKSEP